MKAILWVMSSMALMACAALPQTGNVITGTATEMAPQGSLYRYRGEILITINGVKSEGMAVVPLTGPLTIRIESKFGLDRLQFTTCSRQDVVRDPGGSWFGKSKSYDYQYSPGTKEMAGQCPLYIEAFNKSSLGSWGFVAFRSDEKLTARVQCNGVNEWFPGYSVCQTRAGLDQSISFDTPVTDFEADKICNIKKVDNKNFDLRPGLGMCVVTFYDGTNWHGLNLLGYQRVLVQGE